MDCQTLMAVTPVCAGVLNGLSDSNGCSGGDGSNRSRFGGGTGERAVVLETNDPVIEALAIQRLKELAPLSFLAGAAVLHPVLYRHRHSV